MQIGLIFARGTNGAFGLNNALPWRLPEDMAHFATVTKGGVVIMGHQTWKSLPPKYRPLSERFNIVITSQWERYVTIEGQKLYFVQDPEHAIALAKTLGVSHCWLIGGAALIETYQDQAQLAIVTEVGYDGAFDTTAPMLHDKWRITNVRSGDLSAQETAGLNYRFLTYLNNP